MPSGCAMRVLARGFVFCFSFPLVSVVVFLIAGFKPTKTMTPDPSAYKDSLVWKFLHPEDRR